jgi:signal transduction histidine kinase
VKRTRLQRLERWAFRVLTWRSSAAEAIRDPAYVRDTLRFAAVFSLLVLVPMVLLAWLGLRSLGAEEVNFDVRLRQRVQIAASRVEDDLERLIGSFEAHALREMSQGSEGLERLMADTPGLIGVYRFDAEGRPLTPFRAADDGGWTPPTPAWTRAEAAADDALSDEGRDAAAACDALEAVSETPAQRAIARRCSLRALARTSPAAAAEGFARLAADAADLRDARGFSIGDLATLHRVGLLPPGAEAGREALRRLLESRLAAAWPLGRGEDGTIAERALAGLRSFESASYVQAAEQALAHRRAEAHLSAILAEELGLASRRGLPSAGFGWNADALALWAGFERDGVRWLFAFDPNPLSLALASAAQAASDADADLEVGIEARAEAPIPPHRLLARPLGPWLVTHVVAVDPVDPASIARQRASLRAQRQVVTLLAVGASALGIFAALRMVQRELDAARTKADFAATVSHELRTPLTRIRGDAEALQFDLFDDEGERHGAYTRIVHESDRLARLIDDVLDFAAIGRGAKTYQLRHWPVDRILQRAVDTHRALADARGVTLEVDLEGELPEVRVDPDAMAQVFANLVSNAIKYGGDGRWVGLRAWTEDGAVHLAISDRGIGIPEEELARVFEHYFRADRAEVRAQHGTGIGLTIVRYIVEAHGGRIRVTSRIGRGSTFTVSLPIPTSSPSGAPAHPEA